MFPSVRNEVDRRLLACHQQLGLIARLEAEQSAIAPVCKGMYFVQLYALYEYSVKSTVTSAIGSLAATGSAWNRIRHAGLSLILDPMWEAAAKSGKAQKWDARISVAERIRSLQQTATLNDVPFPADGSHYSVRQLHTIWKVFGLDEPVLSEPRFQGRVVELVENRNYVAHGAKPPEEVGKGFSQHDLVQRTDDIAALCDDLLNRMSSHCQNGGLLVA